MESMENMSLSDDEKEIFGDLTPTDETQKLINGYATGDYGMSNAPKKKYLLESVQVVESDKPQPEPDEDYWRHKGKATTKEGKLVDITLNFIEGPPW